MTCQAPPPGLQPQQFRAPRPGEASEKQAQLDSSLGARTLENIEVGPLAAAQEVRVAAWDIQVIRVPSMRTCRVY